MNVHYVAEISDFTACSQKIVEVAGKSIVIYRIKDQYYALLNHCPHQGAEICKGPVIGTSLESGVYEYNYGKVGEIVRCPWHGWEFDIITGKSLVPGKPRLLKYEVVVEGGKVGIVTK